MPETLFEYQTERDDYYDLGLILFEKLYRANLKINDAWKLWIEGLMFIP